MRSLHARLLGAMSDATIGTAIVMIHALLADRHRERARRVEHARDQPKRLAM